MSRRTGKAPIDPEEDQRLRDEQQRLRDEAEARRIEERRLQIEQQPTPPEVLQYASPPPIDSPLRAPQRRSAFSPENSADPRPYKTPIWAPFFVVSVNREGQQFN